MTLNVGLYYQPSGKVTPIGILMMLGLGGVTAVVLGLVYGYLTLYNPFIYVTFLATAGYGFALGFVAWIGGQKGKIRWPLFALLLGAAVGLLGVYTNWVVWIHALAGKGDESIWFFNPADLLGLIMIIAQEGVWSLRSWTPTGGTLYVIWGLEAVIITVIPSWLCWSGSRETPFCEKCDTWTEAEYENVPFPPASDPIQLRRDLEAGRVDALPKLDSEAPERFTTVSLHACPTCKTTSFLTVEDVTVTQKKGETKTSKTDIARFLTLNPTTLATARELPSQAEALSQASGGEEEPVPAGDAPADAE